MIFRRTAFTGLLLLGFVFILQMQSCRQDDFNTSPNLHLNFDTDTLLFDTVFTSVGSSTRFFKVYNPHNSRINISNLELAGGSNSYFRINADGRSGVKLQDIEIAAKDSIFVFVEVTVDPLGQDLPLVIADSVMFELNSRQQNVKLVAWGQDANFITPNAIDTVSGFTFHYIYENTVWTAERPYVIQGIVIVAPEVSLTIEKGARIHLSNQSVMAFDFQAALKVMGTIEEPVTFQGSRLESVYKDLPGQWGYIYLSDSELHEINNAVIQNGTFGIIMEHLGSTILPTLRMSNTIIKNMDQMGLWSIEADIEAENLVVANCGQHTLALTAGGSYSFVHTTSANYYNLPGPIRQTPSVVVTNYFIDTSDVVHPRPLNKAYFGNSIIYGSLQDELLVDIFPETTSADFVFEHSLLRTSLQSQFPAGFVESQFNKGPQFVDQSIQDYRLLEESPAIGAGSKEIASGVLYDILGNSRLERVDQGAYQYYEIEEDSLATKRHSVFYPNTKNNSVSSERAYEQLKQIRRRFRSSN